MDQSSAATDHELMHRLRQGDAVAFEQLVERWQQPLGRLVTHLLGPTADAEDICQEVFVRVLRARERYRPGHAFSTWVYRIALNVVRDNRRRENRRPAQSLPREEVTSSAPTPAEAVAQQETARAVAAAVAELADPLREILVLKHFGKLSFSEVAFTLGIPVSTVKSRMQAALNQLRSALRQHGLDDKS